MGIFKRVLGIVIVLQLIGCKKVQPEIPQADNPCNCETQVTADFEISERFGVVNSEWVYLETDTTFCPSMVRFKAKEESATYKWYIGNATYTSQVVDLNFQEIYAGNTITVTCVVQREPNLYCFPFDDGYDSIAKTFVLSYFPIFNGSDQVYNYGLEGVYRVLNPTTHDSIDITVSFENYQELHNYAKITNFDGLGTESLDSNKKVKWACYRRIDFEGSTVMNYTQSLSGSIYNKMGGKSYLSFSTNYTSNPAIAPVKTEWNYVGRKL